LAFFRPVSFGSQARGVGVSTVGVSEDVIVGSGVWVGSFVGVSVSVFVGSGVNVGDGLRVGAVIGISGALGGSVAGFKALTAR
jgi:hypothetical protein